MIIQKMCVYCLKRIRWIASFITTKQVSDHFDILHIEGKKSVALIPHADDELIGLGTLLYRNSAIKLIYFECLGSDESTKNRNIRMREFQQYCGSNGIDYMMFDEGAKQEIINSDVVLLPSIVDWHSDHRKMNYILRELLCDEGKKPLIYWYNISVFCSSRIRTKYILEKPRDLIKKHREFSKIYRSQQRIPFYRYMIKERIYGKMIGKYAAEKYICNDYDSWIRIIDRFDERYCDKDMHEVKKAIDRFDRVDTIASDIYIQIMQDI